MWEERASLGRLRVRYDGGYLATTGAHRGDRGGALRVPAQTKNAQRRTHTRWVKRPSASPGDAAYVYNRHAFSHRRPAIVSPT